MNGDIPKDDKELQDLMKYLQESESILKFFKPMNIDLKGEIDFIISTVKKEDIISILNDDSKKYYIFGDKSLFDKESYEIFGEITINLFHPSNYVKKFKQLLRYIAVIKLYENNPDYFYKRKIKKVNRAIMIVTNGNYVRFINLKSKLDDVQINGLKD